MKLLILGATGPTGRHLVAQALEAGHEVAALVRNPDTAAMPAGVEVIHGDATDAATIASAVRGRDAVISSLGTGKSFHSGQVVSRAAANLVAANVRRVIFVSAFGVGEWFKDSPILPKIFFRTLLREIYADKAKADDLIRQSGAEWTIVMPVGLRNGPKTGKYRVGEHIPVGNLPAIRRADVADFIIRDLTDRTWIRKSVVISS